MRALMILSLGVFFLAAPNLSYADENVVETIITTVKENPAKSVGVVACVALIGFPPAAMWCLATIVGGAAYDGDIQKMMK